MRHRSATEALKLTRMVRSLVYTSFLVPDYDEALAFFMQVLRWRVREDRWDLIQPNPHPTP